MQTQPSTLRRFFAGLFLAISLTASSHATTFYVDPVNGNDTYDGLAPAYTTGTTGPFQSVHRALKGTSLISSITPGSPATIETLTPHGLTTSDQAAIFDVVDNAPPQLNATYTVTRITDYVFTVPVNVAAGGTGGRVRKIGSAGPGDIVYLRGGVYRSPAELANENYGNYYSLAVSYACGSASAPLTIAAYPGEKPILKGSLRTDSLAAISSVDTSTDVVTTTATHDLAVNTKIRLRTSSSLPGGLSTGTDYYVKTVPSATTLTLSTSLGGSTVNITSAGSGTHWIGRAWTEVDAVKHIWKISNWMCDSNNKLKLTPHEYSYVSNPQQVFVSDDNASDPDAEKTDGHALFQVSWPTTAATTKQYHETKPRISAYSQAEIATVWGGATPAPHFINSSGDHYNGPDGTYADFSSSSPIYQGYPFEGGDPDPGEYTFFYAETDNGVANTGTPDTSDLFIRLPAGVDPNSKVVEVSVSGGIGFGDTRYVHVKDIAFRHCNSEAGGGGSALGVGPLSVVENCDIAWCDTIGVALGEGSVLLNTRLDWCGKNGVTAQKNARASHCYIGHSNYRNFNRGWDCGAFAKGSPGNILESSELAFNYAPAVWFDYATATAENPIVIRNNHIHDNVGYFSEIYYISGSVAITGVGTGNPATIDTASAHGFTTGQTIIVHGQGSSPDINGTHIVTVVDADTFTIPVNVTSGVSGGGVGWPVGYFDRTMSIVEFEVSAHIQCYGNLIRGNIGHAINFSESLECDVHDNIIMENNADGGPIETPYDSPQPWNHIGGVNGGRGPLASSFRYYRNIFHNNTGDGYIVGGSAGNVLALGINYPPTDSTHTSANNISENNIYSFPDDYTLAPVTTTVTGGGSTGTTTFNVASTTGIAIGRSVWAPNVSLGSVVTAINGNTITISQTIPATIPNSASVQFGRAAMWLPWGDSLATFEEWQENYGYDVHSRVVNRAQLAFLNDVDPHTDIGALARSIATQWTYPTVIPSVTQLDAGSSSNPSIAFGGVTVGTTQQTGTGIFFDPTVSGIGLSIDGQVVAKFDQYGMNSDDGTAAHPGYGFSGDAEDDTGIYLKSVSPDVIGIATDGVERLTIGSTGLTLGSGATAFTLPRHYVLHHSESTTDIVSTSTEQTLYSCTIPANALGTNGELLFEIPGDYLNNSGAARTFTLRVKLGGTTIYEDASTSLGAAATRRVVLLRGRIKNLTSSSQRFSGEVFVTGVTAPTTGTGALSGTSSLACAILGTGSKDTTSSQTFSITIQHSASHASLSLRALAATAVVLAP